MQLNKTCAVAAVIAVALTALQTEDSHAFGRRRNPAPRPAPTAEPTSNPVQYFNLVIEVFHGDVAQNRRVPGALVRVGSDSRTSDGNGFTHFNLASGGYTVRVEAPGYDAAETQLTLDQDNMRLSVSMNPTRDPNCVPSSDNDGQAGGRPLPNARSTVEAVAAERPDLLRASCVEQGGNNEFLFEVVRRLRQTDVRWGLNWKRANIGDMSQDVINYYRGTGPFSDGMDTYVIDIIGGHCGPNPVPAWNDVTGVGGAGARWTIAPIPNKCGN